MHHSSSRPSSLGDNRVVALETAAPDAIAVADGCMEFEEPSSPLTNTHRWIGSVSPTSSAFVMGKARQGKPQQAPQCQQLADSNILSDRDSCSFVNASWQVPPECLSQSWDGSCSSDSPQALPYSAQAALGSRSADNSASTAQPQLNYANTQQQKSTGMPDPHPGVGQAVEELDENQQIRLGAWPSFTSWRSNRAAVHGEEQQQRFIVQIQQPHCQASRSQPLPRLDSMAEEQRDCAAPGSNPGPSRISFDAAGIPCSTPTSISMQALPLSVPNWGRNVASIPPMLSISATGHGNQLQPGHGLFAAQPCGGIRAGEAASGTRRSSCSSIPSYSSVNESTNQVISSKREEGSRMTPPASLQVPPCPQPQSICRSNSSPAGTDTAHASAAPASESSSLSMQTGPSPPSGMCHAPCASPKVNMLFRQRSASSSGCSAAMSASPSVSPAVHPARLHSQPFNSSLGKDTAAGNTNSAFVSHQGPAAAAGAEAGMLSSSKNVYRDISDRLHACTETQQPVDSMHGTWQAPAQHSQNATPRQKSSNASLTTIGDSVAHADGLRTQQHAAGAKSVPSLRSGHPASAMSPVPPAVPPSPAQQQAAALRRASVTSSSPCCSPAQILASWTPNQRPRGWTPKSAAAAMQIDVSESCLAYSGASACRPNSPGVASFLGQMKNSRSATDLASQGIAPLPLSHNDSRDSSNSSRTGGQLMDFVPLLGGSISIPAVPQQRVKRQPQQQHPLLGSISAADIDEDDLLLLLGPTGSPAMDRVSEQGYGSLDCLSSIGRLSDPGAVMRPLQPSRLSDQGTWSSSKLIGNAGAIMSRHTDHGVVSSGAAAAAEAAAARAMLTKSMQHSRAPRPPLQQPAGMLLDYPGTPKSQSYVQQQLQDQQHSVQRSKLVRRSISCDQQQLQQQHPVPPKQTAPLCRSPSVGMRVLLSSPNVPCVMQSGQLHSHICSPVPEQQSAEGADDINKMERLMRLGSLEPESSRSSSITGTATFSSVNAPGSCNDATNSSSSKTTGQGSSSGHRAMLPRPAFEQFYNAASVSTVQMGSALSNCTSAGENTAAASSTADAAITHQQHQQQPLNQKPTLCPSISISEPVLPLGDAGIMHSIRTGRSGSEGTATHSSSSSQKHSTTPHPPDQGLSNNMLQSPRAGMAVHSTAIQSCPTHGIHMHGLSPAVKARLANAPPVHSAPHLLRTNGEQHALSGAADGSPTGKDSAGAVPGQSDWQNVNMAAETAAGSKAQLDNRTAAKSSSTAHEGHMYTLGASLSWDAAAFCSATDRATQLLSPVDETAAKDTAGADENCPTPTMDWDVPRRQQQDAQQQAQHDHHHQQHDDACMRDVAAAAAAQFDGCPGWPQPVVAAYAHYKGRLGYLMSSGIVGVVFEDSTHLIVRSRDGWACYREPNSITVTPGAGTALAVPSDLATASGLHDSSAMSHARRSSDTGRSSGPVNKDQYKSAPERLDAVKQPQFCHADAATATLAATAQDQASGTLFFTLPLAGHADGTFTETNSKVHQQSAGGTAAVPEHLSAKARCLRRFVGCLLYHKPYSSHCQPDITRLPFPVARKAYAAAMAAAKPKQEAPVDASVLHVRRFVYREGSLHLKLTDGSTQLVFTGDNSVLLLNSQCSQLAYVTYSKHHRSSSKHTVGSHGESSPATRAGASAAPGPAAHVALMAVNSGAAAPADAQLLARIVYASKLVRTLQLPQSWKEAGTAHQSQCSPAKSR